MEAADFFRASTRTIVGNWQGTLFWLDSWIRGVSIRAMAPTLMKFVPKRVVNRFIVAEALPERHWVADHLWRDHHSSGSRVPAGLARNPRCRSQRRPGPPGMAMESRRELLRQVGIPDAAHRLALHPGLRASLGSMGAAARQAIPLADLAQAPLDSG